MSTNIMFSYKTYAQTRDAAGAQALFDEGKELASQGKIHESCMKFRASYDLDAAAGTMTKIGKCDEYEGKYASAWISYKKALELNQTSRQTEDRKNALKEFLDKSIESIADKIPKLTIQVAQHPEGLVIRRNDSQVPLSSVGQALPVDAGTIEITAQANGYAPFHQTISLANGEAKEVFISLQLLLPAALPSKEVSSPLLPVISEKPAKDPNDSVPSWVWVTGIAGIGMIAGAVPFRLMGAAAEENLLNHCVETGDELLCDSNNAYDPSEDNATKNRNLGMFIGLSAAGAIALTVATVGYIQSKSQKKNMSKSGMSSTIVWQW